MKALIAILVLFCTSLVRSQTLWTDALAYWVQMPLVREGAFEVLFRDNRFNYNDQTNNVCWNAFQRFRTVPVPAVSELLQL